MIAGTSMALAGFDEFFESFLARARCLPAPALPRRGLDMAQWPAETMRFLGQAGHGYWSSRREHESRLVAALESVAPHIDASTLVTFARSHICILPVPDLCAHGDGDVIYIKINHGFWEQIYAIFGQRDPGRMRIADTSGFTRQYVESGFHDALRRALEPLALETPERWRSCGLHLAVSLGNGGRSHAALLRDFDSRDEARKRVAVGAAIGVAGWWQASFPGAALMFDDGCLPKTSLMSGELTRILAWACESSDQVIFVVPPHLKAVRLAQCTLPQRTVIVPGATVHESWVPCLYETSGHILHEVSAGRRVLVLAQCAVFSALLGAFLAHAKRVLSPGRGVLRFLDLGQALDAATPDSGGLWLRTLKVAPRSPFTVIPDAGQ